LLTLRALAAGTVLLAASPAFSSDEPAAAELRAPWWGPEAVVLSGGFYGLRGSTKWDDAVAGLEIRGGSFWWELHLMAGALAASDGNVYSYLGVIADVPVLQVVHLILSFAPGLSASGHDHYLGIPLDFRSTAEVAFAILPRARLGVSFSHMSNGKLGAPNPGVETLSLTLTVLALPY
jgi:lipid A 3-O-deacylase